MKFNFYMVIYEAKGLLMHGVTEYHAFLYRHVSDDAWPSIIITHTCNSGLRLSFALIIITLKSFVRT